MTNTGTFVTSMLGENEIPGPGDSDGFGVATVTAAHIHVGDAGVTGPVVAPLAPPTSGGTGGCLAVDDTLIGNVLADPSHYYVNVHNADFPSGALHGQLED